MYQYGKIATCKCIECNAKCPVFIFVADTDMITVGCTSLTGVSNNIILTIAGCNESIQSIERRVGLPLKVVQVNVTQNQYTKTSSFQEFLKSYKPAASTYTCIYCGGN